MKAYFFYLSLILASSLWGQEVVCPDCTAEKEKSVSWLTEFLPFYFSDIEQAIDEVLPLKYIKYEENENATFCKRSLDYLTTVVIHHTGESPLKGPEDINDLHLLRGDKDDPWRMVGYHYLISDRYDQKGESEMFIGRPLDYVGAHAGVESYSSRVSDDVVKKMDKQGLSCGHSADQLKFKSVPKNSNGEVNTNVESIGVALMGSYSPLSKDNPGGYIGVNKRYPGENALMNAASLICSLQKKYKSLKYIRTHKQVRPLPTGCPGLAEHRIGKIIAYARAKGCIFE